MPYRYAARPPKVADLRQQPGNSDDAETISPVTGEPPPADDVDEALEAAQEVLDESLEEPPEPPKRKRGRPRKNPDA